MKVSSILSFAALSVLQVAASKNWDVSVGKSDQFRFDPQTISAAIGDTVTYHYYSKNHSVTQSDFHDPCHPAQHGGFYSGFVPADSDSTPSPTTFTITIN